MTQIELINMWINGLSSGQVASVKINGEQLIHYKTVIAQRFEDKIVLNYTRYSLASGRVQKIITDAVPRERLIFVSGIKAGYTGSLTEFIADREWIPETYLMHVRHKTFGDCYVTQLENDRMVCVFPDRTRSFIYPDAVDKGLVEVLDDVRQNK